MLLRPRTFALLTAFLLLPAAGLAQESSPPPENPQTTRLSDAELDQVTAGFVLVNIYNPGGHISEAPRVNEHSAVCINCGGNTPGSVSGFVITPNGALHTVGPR